ncbi:MAG TPA: ATP-binding protein [Thermoanaerobaculia bacterium]|nr:ATP-binding protein [Thermoanaerobaculia bacterium]
MRVGPRFTALFGVLAASAGILLIVLLDATVRRATEDRVLERASRETAHLADDWQRWSAERPADVDRLVREAAARLACRITIVGRDGKVLHETELTPEFVPQMENHANRPEILEARRNGTGTARRYSSTVDDRRIYFARALPGGEVIRVSVPVAGVEAMEQTYLWTTRLAIFSTCLLLFLIGSAAARRFSEPIGRLTDAAHAIASGEHGRELPREGGEEVQLLASALQRMKDSLARAAERAEAERHLTALVLQRLPDGLVVVDAKLHVLEANARFGKMVGITDPAGRALYDLLRNRALYDVFGETVASGQPAERTVRLADEIVWQVSVVALPAGYRAAAVGVLRDVTRLERTESMRRTFIADVSHELRTPIASIAAAAETLAEAEPDEAESKHLLGLIRRQSDRMRELIDDLMDLAQIESGAVELEKSDLSLSSLLSETAADFSAAAAARRIHLVTDADPSLSVEGDRRRLSQVVRNLLDNAIKFSPEAGTVTLRARREGEDAVLSVTDEGPGIPHSEVGKIFQRFYQVDRSRSKSRPGAGLGLAIAKHLVQLHGGAVEVDSELGRGSTFRVRFPAR